jgi:hypothetical protein
MQNDPIVEQVRKARQKYAARFNYDLKAIGQDLRRREADSARAGRKVVTLSPRPAPTSHKSKK